MQWNSCISHCFKGQLVASVLNRQLKELLWWWNWKLQHSITAHSHDVIGGNAWFIFAAAAQALIIKGRLSNILLKEWKYGYKILFIPYTVIVQENNILMGVEKCLYQFAACDKCHPLKLNWGDWFALVNWPKLICIIQLNINTYFLIQEEHVSISLHGLVLLICTLHLYSRNVTDKRCFLLLCLVDEIIQKLLMGNFIFNKQGSRVKGWLWLISDGKRSVYTVTVT